MQQRKEGFFDNLETSMGKVKDAPPATLSHKGDDGFEQTGMVPAGIGGSGVLGREVRKLKVGLDALKIMCGPCLKERRCNIE